MRNSPPYHASIVRIERPDNKQRETGPGTDGYIQKGLELLHYGVFCLWIE